MKEITANITVIAYQQEGEEDIDIDTICLPLEEQGFVIQSAVIQEEN